MSFFLRPYNSPLSKIDIRHLGYEEARNGEKQPLPGLISYGW